MEVYRGTRYDVVVVVVVVMGSVVDHLIGLWIIT
jgi:hypothetical protein